jgi:signal transduction histidine kinase/ligand-binding sensor domain-containing protein
LAWCARALALDPKLAVYQYAHTAWNVRDGFVKGSVASLAQTPDGYLWIGTSLGLWRFDGVRAVQWQPPPGASLPSEYIAVLRVTASGRLWIGTERGLASLDGGSLHVHPAFEDQYVVSILEDREGTVWVGGANWKTATGFLCAIRSSQTDCKEDKETFGAGVVSLYEDSGGALWLATVDAVWRWKPGPPKRFSLASPTVSIAQVLAEFHGKMLVATADGVQQIVGERVEPFVVPGEKSRAVVALFRDQDGALWIGTQAAGLVHVGDRPVDALAPLDGLSGGNAHSILEDREGSVWVATEGGIDRFCARAVVPYAIPQGVGGAVLAGRSGSVWIAAQTGLYEIHDGRLAVYRGRPLNERTADSTRSLQREAVHERVIAGMPDVASATLFEDGAGRVWMGARSSLGFVERGRYVPVRGAADGYIDAIFDGPEGSVWIAHRVAGLLRWSQDRKLERFAWPTGWQHIRVIRAIRATADPVRGGVWAGIFEGDVVHVVDGAVRATYSTHDGLGRGAVRDLQAMQDGTVWVATERGLSRIKNGAVAKLNTSAGLPCDAVQWFITDDDGAIWMRTPCGLVRVARSDVQAWTAAIDQGRQPPPFALRVFDNSDGFIPDGDLGSFTPHVTKAADGKLWFVTNDGVAVVDPRHLPFNKVPPPVHIDQVVADHKTYEVSSGVVQLPPLVRDVTIDYTALSFVAPGKVQFRYKLEGQDPDWRQVVNDRDVQYSNLAPGHYRFRVTASNDSGVWNEQGATLELEVTPAYWQTNWFRALVVIALLALAYTLYRLRVAQIARHFAATLDARVNERTRIARDLHDTLLQSFHGLVLRFQTARALLPANPAQATEILDSAIDQTARAITEGRDAVQDLRASTTEMNDLAESIRALGEDLSKEGGSEGVLRVEVQGASRALHPIVRDEVFRIAGEALRNAFRHAHGEIVEVEIRYDERQFRLRVRDDGKGIDSEVVRTEGRVGHFGLRGMRERAKVVGGKLTVWSAPGTGTEVELSVPASRAYGSPTS